MGISKFGIMRMKNLFPPFSFVLTTSKTISLLLPKLLNLKTDLVVFKKMSNTRLPGKAIFFALSLVTVNLFSINKTFATNYKLPAGVYGTQTGTATYGAISTVTYTISYTVATTAASSNADQLALAWTSGAPTGVTYTLTSATLTLTGGSNAVATFLPTSTGTKTITLTITTSAATPASTTGYGFTLTTTDNNSGVSGSSSGLKLVVGTKALTITANNQTKVYGTTFTFAGTEFTTAGLVGSDAVTSASFTSAGASSTATVAGSTYTITPSAAAGSGLANYTISYAAGSFTVTVKTLTVTSPVAANKVYDGTTSATITGTLSGIVSPDAVTLSGAGTFASANVGSGIVVTPTCTLTGANAGNYTLTQPSGLTATINAAPLTITANNVSKVYGTLLSGAAGSTAFTPSGLQNSETIGSVSIAYGTGSAINDPVGTNTGTVTATTATGGTFTAGNYSITYLPGNITITAKPLTVTGATASNKVYDGITTATITGGALMGVVSPDVVSIGTTGTFASTNVANGIVVTLSLTGANASNYTLTQPGITANITTKTVTVTAVTASNKAYDGTTTATVSGGTLTGVVSPDVVSVNATGIFASAGVANGIVVTLALTGANAGNYTLTQPAITANITPKVLTVTGATASNKVYDRTTIATITGGTLSGVVSPDVVSISTTGTFASANVANGIVVTLSLTGANAGNYTLTQPGITANIAPKALTMIGAAAGNKVYDGTTAAIVTGGTLLGVISPDAVTINAACTFATANVGTGILLNFYIGGADAGNYTLTQPVATANITPKALTETGATAANKVYDGTTVATVSGGTLAGLVGTDIVSVSTAGTFASANAGTGITVTIALTGTNAGNYTITQSGITANITPKALTITGLTISSKSYDGTTTASISGTAALSGVIGSDVVVLGGSPTAVFASQNVATGISVIVTGYAISGASAGNYTLTQPGGLTANITTATLNIVATGPPKVNGTAQANLSGAASVGYFNYYGAVPGESISSVTLTLSNTGSQTAGSAYTVTPSLPVGPAPFNINNYSITYSSYSGIVAGHIYTWTGGANTTSWTTTANWSSSPSGGTYPGSSGVTYDGVILPSGTTYTPTLSSSLTVNTLTYTGNNTLTIASGVKLTSDNSFIVNSTATNANLKFLGSSTSTILELSSSVFSNYGGFNISGTGLFQIDNTGSYIYNGGTITANGNCTLYLQGGSNVTHALTNAGIFYAGTANSNCNIEMDDYGSIENSGSFYLGPTSLMYYYNDNAQYVIINNENGGTFTLQSNANGSATIGEIPQGKNNAFTGTFNVERYFQGSTTVSLGRYIERNYRIISSCVNTGTIVNGNYVYGLNYIVGATAGQTTAASSTTNAFITGCTGCSTSGGNPSIYLYNESKTPSNQTFTSGNFLGITNITNSTTGGTITASDGGTYSLPVGTGVFFFFRGAATNWATRTISPYIAPDNVTLTSTGNMNVGSYTFKDWYTPTSANLGFTGTGTGTNYAVRGFNMIGNPYPSAIDWCAFYSSGTNGITRSAVAPTIWVFNPRTSQYDTFLATSSSGGTATGNASRYVASGQGFVVQATTASASLVISEYAKVVLNNNGVAGTGAVPVAAKLIGDSLLMSRQPIQTEVPQSLRLKLVTDSINYDDIYIGFNSSSSTAYNNNEDAMFLPGNNAPESLASFSSDGVQLSVNSLPLPKLAPQVIKLLVTAKTKGTYTLQRTDLQAIPKIYDIWLIDNFKKDSLDIRNNSTYTFDITTDTTTYGNNRFQLLIRQNPALAIHLLNFTATKVQAGAQAVWVTENEENYTNFTIERSTDGGNTFTVLGGYVSSALGTYSFLDKNPANGANMYRVKIEDLNGTITYSNVVTLIYGNVASLTKTGIVVYPNPAKSTLNLNIAQGLTASTTPSVAYNIQITNILGSVVTKAKTNAQNWQTDLSSLMPGSYVITVINASNSTTVGQVTFIKL